MLVLLYGMSFSDISELKWMFSEPSTTAPDVNQVNRWRGKEKDKKEKGKIENQTNRVASGVLLQRPRHVSG